MKTFRTSKLLVAALLLASALALGVFKTSLNPLPSGFGLSRPLPQHSALHVRAFADEALTFDIVSRVGGLLFQGTATPEEASWWTATKRFFCDDEINYDADAPNGARYAFSYACHTATLPFTDELLGPVIDFVATDETAAMTLLGRNNDATLEEVERADELDTPFIVQFHPAFEDTLVGNMFMLADSAFVSSEILLAAASWNAPLRSMLPGVSEAPEGDIDSVLETIYRAGDEKCRQFDSYLIVDTETKYVWNADSEALRIEGEPYYSFWCENPAATAHHFFQLPIAKVRPSAPYVYETVSQVGKAAAFVRWFRAESYAKKGPTFLRWFWDDTDNWKDLIDSNSSVRIQGYETPGFWVPSASRRESILDLLD